MNYYEVAPAYRQLHSRQPLTYQSTEFVTPGQIVVVKIRQVVVVAIVIKKVSKPGFATQPIIEITDLSLPPYYLNLMIWLMEYYPSPIGPIGGLFLPSSLKRTDKLEGIKETAAVKLPNLTQEQYAAIKQIQESKKPSTFFLHGDTATGKSRVYIELAKTMVAEGKSVVILTPEISLTPQLLANFNNALGQSIYVTHSSLTTAQKRQLWSSTIKATKPVVVIGPRSALFMPVKNLGLIVLDEAHETAYKQDQLPRYQAARVASKLAELSGARLIFGSATPLISEYYIAQQKGVPILRMQEKPLDQKSNHKPVIKVVELTDKNEKTKFPLLSQSLISAIQSALEAKEQSLIFINRRGSARAIVCQNCGWQAVCPRCDLPYTYHADEHILRCHTCGLTNKSPSNCQVCGSIDIIFKSPGTKSIVSSLEHIFPDANIARFDRDNLKAETFEASFQKLQTGVIDIMVGTQILAKGHDLPRLSCVGILLADNELNFPDFSSEERSYQLIKQLIGRVGRGHRSGHVIIQTYDKNSSYIKAASDDLGWEDFYATELANRKKYGFPPFAHFLKIEVMRASQRSAKQSSEKIAEHLKGLNLAIEVMGPHPSFIEKRNGKWIWQLIVSAKNRASLIEIIQTLSVKCSYDLDPSNLL